MDKWGYTRLSCLVTLGLALGGGDAIAQQSVPIGKIDLIENGWFGEGLALTITGPGLAGCPYGANHFAIANNHPSYKELTAMALSAFVSSTDVQIVATPGDCAILRTRVIAIRMIK